MRRLKQLDSLLIVGTTVVLGTTTLVHARKDAPAPVVPTVSEKAVAIARAPSATFVTGGAPAEAEPKAELTGREAEVASALGALSAGVREQSHPKALEYAVRSYYAYKASHPDAVRKPYLYFVDYGLPSTVKRGYVFDMERLAVVEGPFTVAHGRGSGPRSGIPTRFTNLPGAATTSLGLYLAQETYGFSGHAGGGLYRSIGLRLKGLSGDFNDRARERGVVAHGAPYVTASGSGRSEGCPAMEQNRAGRLLPKLANGSLVFLFAPNAEWMARDPWLTASAN